MARGASRVDRKGGYRQAGLISGVSVITAGEALGHDLWIDGAMLAQVEEAINQRNKGIKSRFTHPSMSGDGLGSFVGRMMDAEMSADGSKVLADQHFSDAGHSTPNGDLAAYLMDLAESEPDAYGLSIVFGLDVGEMDRFTAEHADELGTFLSPDPKNKRNLPHARMSELRAIDAVDEPAANPGGLFHREQDIVEQADALASFALGITDRRPATLALGLDADRVRGFVARFLSTNQLEVKKMADEATAVVTEPVVQPAAVEAKPEENPTVAGESAAPAEPVAAKSGQDFLAAFGDHGGVWFAQGKSWDEASALFTKSQADRIAELETQLSATKAGGEATPVSFSSADEKPKRQGLAGKIRFAVQSAK